MCDPLSATIAASTLLIAGTQVVTSRQKPKMPPMPQVPEIIPSKASPESKLPKVNLGQESGQVKLGQESKAGLKRDRRRRRLSLADLDLSQEEIPEPTGARNVRSF